MRVGIQGEQGAHSEAAARTLYGKTCVPVGFTYFEEVFHAVQSGKVHRGLVPIENSLAGSIHQNYDLLQQYHFTITGEIFHRVEHVLMCHPMGSWKSLREVRSHPQALAQCSRLFKGRRGLTPTAYYDTAGSAKYVAENPSADVGAIASHHAAKVYKLKVLKRHVENNPHNFTRFLSISKGPVRSRAGGGDYKSSLSVVPKSDESGMLFKMLSVFALRNINLLKIESRPLPDSAFDYVFYLDFAGHAGEKPVQKALEHLKEFSTELQFYGSYRRGRWGV